MVIRYLLGCFASNENVTLLDGSTVFENLRLEMRVICLPINSSAIFTRHAPGAESLFIFFLYSTSFQNTWYVKHTVLKKKIIKWGMKEK